MEDLIVDYKQHIKELYSCLKILQRALQNDDFPAEYEDVENYVEIMINKTNLIITLSHKIFDNINFSNQK